MNNKTLCVSVFGCCVVVVILSGLFFRQNHSNRDATCETTHPATDLVYSTPAEKPAPLLVKSELSVTEAALVQAKKDFPYESEENLKRAIAAKVNLKMIKEERVPKISMQLNSLVVVIRQYQETFGKNLKGGNIEITRALLGDNPQKKVFYEARKKDTNSRGELLDPWGTVLCKNFVPSEVA